MPGATPFPLATDLPGTSAGDQGKVAYVQGGDIWVRALPGGEPQRLTDDGRNDTPRWSPSRAWLTFHKGDETWLMRADGAHSRPVPGSSFQYAVWSPAADRLAYVADRPTIRIIEADALADTGLPGEGRLLMEAIDGEELHTAVQGLAWSPDGRRLAYALQSGPPDALPDRVSIGYVDLESGPSELYAPPGRPQDGLILAGWTPDGRAVLFWRDLMFSASAMADGLPLLRVPLEGGDPVAVVNFTLLHADFWSCSPAGRHIALTVGGGRETWTNKRIALFDLATGGWEYLTDGDESAFSPVFSPNGLHIAYASAPDVGNVGGGDAARAGVAERRIWIMNLDGSDRRSLTSDPAYRDERPVWSADGDHILFARMDEDGRASLWYVDVAGGPPERVVDELTPAPDWFGYYGYVDWSRWFDWWTGSGGD